MRSIAVVLVLVAAAMSEAVHKPEKPLHRLILPLFDELSIYKFEDFEFITAGEKTVFTVLDKNGTCQVVEADEDAGIATPFHNQTICDQIAATECLPEAANLTCTGPHAPLPENGNGENENGEHENGNGGPLCHLLVDGKKIQPSGESAFLFIQDNTFKSCHFQVNYTAPH